MLRADRDVAAMGKGSNKAKLRRKKAKAKSVAAAAPPAAAGGGGGGSSGAAAEYLEQWTLRDTSGAWKFSKVRQTFLLKGWPHRQRVTGETFKLFLAYLRTLTEGCQQRTLEQAREVAASAEKAEQALEARSAARRELAADADGDEDEDEDGDAEGEAVNGGVAELEEQRAVLRIQRARALRVLSSLVEQ